MLCRNVKFLVRRKYPMRCMSTNVTSSQNKTHSSEPVQDRTKSARSTVDHDDVMLHEKLKHQWWNTEGPMRGLHSLNKLRVPFIRDGLINTVIDMEQKRDTPLPLTGTKILEVGCGGGILTEPLTRLGANVIGLDASEQLVLCAKDHALDMASPNLEYVHNTIEDFANLNYEQFDGVVASEIVEHVNDKELFIQSCVKALRPGGSMFITTLNKTNLAWLGGILIAENVLKIVPPGTHQWEKFISPNDMTRLLDKYDCKTKMVHGMLYFFINNEWYWTSNTSINYAVHAVKNN